MERNDITTPTVTRRKGEPLDVWHERKRAARRQRNREDMELARLHERHDFATLDALSAAIFRGQQ
jgi:hypothetical protein